MDFELHKALQILERTPKVLSAFLVNLSEDWTHSNEGNSTWNPFDIIGHLIHGEHTDWLERTAIILSENSDKTFIPFDRFAQFENSKGKTLHQLLDEFETLRSKNLEKLAALNLTEDDLEKKGVHPDLGPVTLRQLLSAWVTHDLSHISQIARVMAKQYSEEVGPWKAYMNVLSR